MISREDIIEQSVEDYLRTQLFDARGYPPDRVSLLDAYPTQTRMQQALDRNYIAIGYSFDDGGKQAELGSSLKRRLHTIDFHIFGLTRVWGRNLAAVARYALETDGNVPLKALPDETVIGALYVDFVSAQQAPVNNPRPWQENIWIVRLRVEDFYDPSGGGG